MSAMSTAGYPYAKGVFIGRFQPVHAGHLHVIVEGLQHCRQLIIIVGSIRRARTVKNPFTYEERVQMLHSSLQEYDQQHGTAYANRVIIRGVEDQMYDNDTWFNDIYQLVREASLPEESIAVVGHDKDHSTWYLSRFAHWGFVEVGNYEGLNATPIRHAFLSLEQEAGAWSVLRSQLSRATQAWLATFACTEDYRRLRDEYAFIVRYKAQWAHTPYPPIFVTTDSVVFCQNHVLLIKRKFYPGEGLWALPGGFLNANELIETGLLRELREETSIGLSDETLRLALCHLQPFDHPDRSQIGRVITNAGWFELPGDFPEVRAADDAADLQWFPLHDFAHLQHLLHDDHYYILKFYLQLRSERA